MNRSRLVGESIYSVFIRNHSDEGNIEGLISDLDRIKSLGVSIVWILPHYPIGKKNRKGAIGSPYSISDYYGVNEEYGGLNDFKKLVKECHKRGLKLIIDIVFNHTSCDSELLHEHKEWFIHNRSGENISKVSQWSDVYDLDFSNKELWSYLIDVLKYWAELDIDGFRCDVASIVPLSFWAMAREVLNKDHAELIWIAESVEKEFVSFIRHKGFSCHSDSELFNVFDILYDYDVQNTLEGYILGYCEFKTFVRERRNQEVVYPGDYLKLRFLENHDSNKRAASLIKNEYSLRNWKAFSIFEKGIPLLLAGEEYQIKDKLDLFENKKIMWQSGKKSYYEFIQKLLSIEHLDIVTNGIYTINPLDVDCIHIRYRYNGETLHGIFNFGKKERVIRIEVLEGSFKEIISGQKFIINNESLNLNCAPLIFKSIP